VSRHLQGLTARNLLPVQRKERRERKKEKKETEKPLLFKRHKVVRFLISPNQKKVKSKDWKMEGIIRIWKTTTPKEKTYKKKTNEKMKEM
jgi:hypothetical protein